MVLEREPRMVAHRALGIQMGEAMTKLTDLVGTTILQGCEWGKEDRTRWWRSACCCATGTWTTRTVQVRQLPKTR
jgi:hypothetical protein